MICVNGQYHILIKTFLSSCNDKDVFITPGTVFGSQGGGYIRFSLCVSKEVIEEAISRFA